jgi:hypothetical protein
MKLLVFGVKTKSFMHKNKKFHKVGLQVSTKETSGSTH